MKALLTTLAAALLLAGCGQKGPLYLPQAPTSQAPDAQQQAPAPQEQKQ